MIDYDPWNYTIYETKENIDMIGNIICMNVISDFVAFDQGIRII